MAGTSKSLKDSCIDFICDNLSVVCKIRSSVEGQVCRVLSTDDEFYLPSDIAEPMLVALSDKGKIEDWMMLMLFDSEVAVLRKVRLENASKLTINGLRILRSHKILCLEVMGLTNLSVNDLIGCLGDWTLQHLRTLNVAKSTFVDKEGYYDVLCLSKLRNLQILNVRNTEFNEKGLEIVVDNLPKLENLDISETSVSNINSLKECRNRLKSLTMYKMLPAFGVGLIDVICDLHLLQHLDISSSHCSRVLDFLRHPSSHPFLTSLDISSIQQISIEDVRYFLVHHPNIRFLGLARSDLCNDEMFTDLKHHLYNPYLVIAGSANEAQILEVLRRYQHRVVLCRVAMSDLLVYLVTQHSEELKLDIISLILAGMKTNPKDLIIQIHALRCLEKLFDGEKCEEINVHWLKQITESVITAMEIFPTDEVLMDTCLSILEKDGVFKPDVRNTGLDKYRYHCVGLLMDTLCTFDNDITTRSVEVCRLATQWMSIPDKIRIGANL